MIRSGKLVSVCPVPSVKAPVTEIKSVAHCSLHHLKCACNRNSMVPKRSLGLRACVACAACAVFAACAACVACWSAELSAESALSLAPKFETYQVIV